MRPARRRAPSGSFSPYTPTLPACSHSAGTNPSSQEEANRLSSASTQRIRCSYPMCCNPMHRPIPCQVHSWLFFRDTQRVSNTENAPFRTTRHVAKENGPGHGPWSARKSRWPLAPHRRDFHSGDDIGTRQTRLGKIPPYIPIRLGAAPRYHRIRVQLDQESKAMDIGRKTWPRAKPGPSLSTEQAGR
jgi:hypothetical protein